MHIAPHPDQSVWTPHPSPGPVALLGSCYLAASDDSAVRYECTELPIVYWPHAAAMLAWILRSAWDSGRLQPKILQPYTPLDPEDVAQVLGDHAEEIVSALPAHDQAELFTWVRFALRGYGADGVQVGDQLIVLGSSAALRPITPLPRPELPPLPPPPTRATAPARAPRRPGRERPRAPSMRGGPLSSDSLLRGMGLHISPGTGEANCHHIDSLGQLRRLILEDALELGVLTSALAYMPLKRLELPVAEDWMEQLLSRSGEITWHRKVAVDLCSGLLASLRSQGFQGVLFADGSALLFPHYALRGLSKDDLWRDLCGA